ncbi:MAG: YdcF family protein [Candidatus Omnitrophica bacterium]|nr:YdcF family protein [Candidatus Omnitrophota bacterium]
MLKNENIICISSIDWDFIWQGHQEIMSVLAEKGNRVLFIENTGVRSPGLRDVFRIRSRLRNWFKGVKGIRKERENLYVFSPLVLPFPYSRFTRWINKYLILSVLNRWMSIMDFADPVVWTFLPTPLTMDVADNIVKKLFIYYCIDSFSASSASANKIKRSEERLLRKADLVFVTSMELYNYCHRHNEKVYKFPFAVNFKEFEKIGAAVIARPEELNGIERPIIGYVGGVHKWIDLDLVKDLAESHPEYSFVFIGPAQTNIKKLAKLKNVHFLGKKEHERLPAFIKYFDVGIIPYLITEYTMNVYPTKLNEYLALAKPVISTALPEILEFNREFDGIVHVAEDAKAFGESLKKAIAGDNDSLRRKRIDVARRNSWENRIEKMSDLILEGMAIKKLNKEARWKENLANFYKQARNKAIKVAIVCLLAYIVLFKTPFIWFMAEPLKISDVPAKADAIVVFGGGVGETGSPGNSTIERARYASELYNNGYAHKIIFSSGYSYIYNDSQNMRLIALSIGVPDKDIILEQKANSAYENVIFAKEMLDKNKWGSILLVSSPYNMRRVSLVFNKHCKGVKVFYTPIIKSQFYDRSSGIKLEQIRAIAHEYLGVLYYWLKGYI